MHEEEHAAAAERMTDFWAGRVSDAMAAGIAPDSPSADDVVGAVVAEWIPTQEGTAWPAGAGPKADGAEARELLLAQLEMAADPGVERYWQLTCLINGLPVRPGLAAPGEWLMTALRANPAPGALAARHEALYASDPAGSGDARGSRRRWTRTGSWRPARRFWARSGSWWRRSGLTGSATRRRAPTGTYARCSATWCGRT